MTEPTFTPVDTIEQRVLVFEVKNAPPLRIQYGKVEIVPDTVVITFERTDFGPWKIRQVVTSGGRLLNSGKASEKEFGRNSSTYGNWDLKDAPSWLKAFVELVEPLDDCAVAVTGRSGDLVPCAEPPVAMLNVRREVRSGDVIAARVAQEPRCAAHLSFDAGLLVPFTTI